MPVEFSRVTAVKRITPPTQDGSKADTSDTAQHVDIPVIQQIVFRDAKTRAQGYNYWTFNFSGTKDDSNDQTTRIVHVETVQNALTQDGSSIIYSGKKSGNTLDVERIDKLENKDAKSRAQGFVYRVSNNDQDPMPTSVGNLLNNGQVVWVDSDGNTFTRLASHVVRYFMNGDKNSTTWIDVELTDKFSFHDAKSRAQDLVFTLNNDSSGDGSPGQIGDPVGDKNDPFSPFMAVFDNSPPDNLGNSSNNVDPPWRTDPFQNIVNVNWKTPIIILEWEFVYSGHGDSLPSPPVCNSFGTLQFTYPDTAFATYCGWGHSIALVSGSTNPTILGPNNPDGSPITLDNFTWSGTPIATPEIDFADYTAATTGWTQSIEDGGVPTPGSNPPSYFDTGRTSATMTQEIWNIPMQGSGPGYYINASAAGGGIGLWINGWSEGGDVGTGQDITGSLDVGPDATYKPTPSGGGPPSSIAMEPYRVNVAIQIQERNGGAGDVTFAGTILFQAYFKLKGAPDPPPPP